MYILSEKAAVSAAALCAGLARASGLGSIYQSVIFSAGFIITSILEKNHCHIKKTINEIGNDILPIAIGFGAFAGAYLAANALCGTALAQSAVSAITSQISNPAALSVITHKFTQGVALTSVAAVGAEALFQIVTRVI